MLSKAMQFTVGFLFTIKLQIHQSSSYFAIINHALICGGFELPRPMTKVSPENMFARISYPIKMRLVF